MHTVTRTLKTLALPVLLILSLIGFDRLAPSPHAGVAVLHVQEFIEIVPLEVRP
ncbi:hypothetical protein [Zestomonas carbonaria]|uniref:Uncharacterized protein n=1 Tax=Zestomonas carbonaria TaxID=2762745 RepID=A0A7U7ENB6_9GAMM|nr:hypothetical protein [Pseudomonas carbonaria]CAD5108137.1 hypothetical protein PSEWESI4_02421 [Pseudomonas carbonaria]